jgi:hypothetical protein
MVDYWPQEEGAIFDSNSYIIPCYPDGAISEVNSVKMGTVVAGRISVAAAAASGDGVGIALRAASGAGAPSRIPVLFYGIVKVTGGSIANHYAIAGSFAYNLSTGAAFLGLQATTIANLVMGGGSSYIMGLWLQGISGGSASESLLLVGKTA